MAGQRMDFGAESMAFVQAWMIWFSLHIKAGGDAVKARQWPVVFFQERARRGYHPARVLWIFPGWRSMTT